MLVVALLAGCAKTKAFFTGQPEPTGDDVGILGTPSVDYYLDDMRQMASGDPASQAETFADPESGALITPGPQTNLRFALVLAVPGHPESDASQAASRLRETLAAPQLLTEGEIALASVTLRWAEELAVSQSEVRQTRASLARSAQSQQSATSRRMATLDAENQRLRQELSEAEEKLEAITSIERSIREQE